MEKKENVLWKFSFANVNPTSSARIPNPAGYRALSSKGLEEAISHELQFSKNFQRHGDIPCHVKAASEKVLQTLTKNAWDLSWSPVKTIGMNLVMLYFMRSSGNIFSVLIMCYALMHAISSLFRLRTVFQPLEKVFLEKCIHMKRSNKKSQAFLSQNRLSTQSSLTYLFWPQKIVYFCITLGMNFFLLYHAATMGLFTYHSNRDSPIDGFYGFSREQVVNLGPSSLV